MRIYLSGPMSFMPEFNFPAFHDAADFLKEQGHEVFNPAERDVERYGEDFSKNNPTGNPSLVPERYGFSLRDALAEDLDWICRNADAIALLPGWEQSKGARAEHATAYALNLQFIYL
jgi:hypothetical protein